MNELRVNMSTTVSARNFRPSIRLSWTKSMHQRSWGRVGGLGTTRRRPMHQGAHEARPEPLARYAERKLSVKIANAAAQATGMPDRFELKERVDVTCPVCGGTFTLQ